MNKELQLTQQRDDYSMMRTVQDMQNFADIMAKSGHFQYKNMAAAFAVLQAGKEIGVGPQTALSNIYIVQGKIHIGSVVYAAKIKQSGKYDYLVTESTREVCTIEYFEKGKTIGTVTFTIQDAKKQGLVKPGGVWEKSPDDMLFARCMSKGAKRFCPDVFMGNAVYIEAHGETEITSGQPEQQAPPAQPKNVTPAKVDVVTSENPKDKGEAIDIKKELLAYLKKWINENPTLSEKLTTLTKGLYKVDYFKDLTIGQLEATVDLGAELELKASEGVAL